MGYKLKWKKGQSQFVSKKTFQTKSSAIKKANVIRQMDDDLPKSRREKWLKTIRVIKAPKTKKIPKRI